MDQVPIFDGGSQLYKACSKLQGRKALITGGDSGIGRVTAVFFAMEGSEVAITYLQEEADDAQNPKKWVEKYGGKCHLIVTNLRYKEECKKTVDKAVKAIGGLNIPDQQPRHSNDAREYPGSTRRTMGTLIHDQRPSLLLSIQRRSSTHDQGGYNHQQRLGKRIHWKTRYAGLYVY